MPSGADFLRVIHQGALDKDGNYDPEFEVEVRPIDQDRKVRLGYRGFANVADATKWALQFDAQGLDGYYGVHLRHRGTKKGGDAAVAAFTCAFADVDCDKHGVTREAVLAVLKTCPWGAPTIVVNSGGGYHPFWVYHEPLDASDLANVNAHQKTQRLIRWWLNDQLGAMAADEMSSRDRILRLPGTHNQKPGRKLPDGSQPLAFAIPGTGQTFECSDVLAWQPEDVKWDHVVGEAIALDPSTLPTSIPEQLRRVIAAAGLHVKPKRLATGQIHALVLSRCPACNDEAGGGRCYLTATGRLKTQHQVHCPAAGAYTAGMGLPLTEWVNTYAPQARAAMATPDVGPNNRPEADRAAIALTELAEAGDDEGLARVISLAGFDDDLRDVVVEAGVAYHPASARAGLSRTAEALCNGAGHDDLMIPLLDVDGRVRAFAFAAPDGRSRVFVHRGFESLGDLPDGLATLGDVRTAIAGGIARRLVVVTETPHDYLATIGLVGMGQLDAEVVGVLGATALRKLSARLNRAWMAVGALPPRVVFVRSANVPDSEATAAAKRLDGRAGVALFAPQPPKAGRPHLAATVRDYKPKPTVRALKFAPFTFPAPIGIKDAGAAVRAEQEKAVTWACQKADDGRQRLAVFVVEAAAGKTHVATRLAADIAAGRFKVPVRSPRPKSWPDDETWPTLRRRVGFALPNHKLTAEMAGRLQTADPQADVEVLKGALAHCLFKKNVETTFPVVGRRGICGDPGSDSRCPEAETCLGAKEPSIGWGQVGFMAHQMATNVKMDLCIIDESTGVMADPNPIDQGMIASLFTSRVNTRVRAWRSMGNPYAGDAALALTAIVQPMANDHAAAVSAGTIPAFPFYLRGAELADLLGRNPDLMNRLRDGFARDADPPPAPDPNDLRGGIVNLGTFPSLAAFKGLQAMLTNATRLLGEADPDAALLVLGQPKPPPPPMTAIQLNTNGTWAVIQIKGNTLPDCPTLLLDATGEVTIDEWNAAHPDREVKVFRVRVQGAAPREARHLRTKGLRKGRVLDVTGGVSQRGAMRVRSAVIRAARMALQGVAGRNASVGLLTYKLFVDLMTGARTPVNAPEHQIAALKAEVEGMGITLTTGYYGKHDRGTNDFENVDALLFIGDPLPNLGAVELQCDWLGLDAATVARNRAHATLVQTGFRARHTRRVAGREAQLIYVGEHAPEMLGVEWTPDALVEHRTHLGQTAAARAFVAVDFVAQEMGALSVKLLRTWEFHDIDVGRGILAGVCDQTLRHAIHAYAAEHKLATFHVQESAAGGPRAHWFAINQSAADEAMTAVFGENRCESARNRAGVGDDGSSPPGDEPDSAPVTGGGNDGPDPSPPTPARLRANRVSNNTRDARVHAPARMNPVHESAGCDNQCDGDPFDESFQSGPVWVDKTQTG